MSWPDATVASVCSLVTDGTHYTPTPVERGVPFVTVRQMAQDGLDFPAASRISASDFETAKDGNSAPVSGDVLFSKDGTIGKVWVVRNEGPFAVLSSIAILRPDPNIIDSGYFAHVLRSPRTLAQATRSKTGSAIRRIILNDLSRLRIPLPPLREQLRVASVLDKADALLRKRQESIRAAGGLPSALFLEEFGDPVGNPRDWPQLRLGKLAEIVSGVTKGRQLDPARIVRVPYMRVANVQDGRIDLEDVREIEALPEEIERFRLQRGDVLLTEGGDPDKLGRGAVWQGAIESCIHQNHVFRVRVLAGALNPEYLSALLGSAHGKRYFLRAAKQTTGIASINMTQLKDFPVLVPPIELQERFSRLTSAARAQRGQLETSMELMHELQSSLLDRAFRGGL